MSGTAAERERPVVGIVAPGKIGMAFARNLIDDGYQVRGYRRGDLSEFVAAGGIAGTSVRDVAENVDLLFTCVTSADALDEVVDGEQGLLSAGRDDLLVIEIGAMSLGRKTAVRDRLAAAGLTMLDSPVSGTPEMVAARRSLVFLGGDTASADRVADLLGALGRVIRTGEEFGSGSKMKFVANTLVALHTAAAAEAMALADSMGLDPQFVIDTISNSAASSTMFTVRAPLMAEHRSRPVNGTVSGMVDIIDAITATAAEHGSPMPLLGAASALYERACALGQGEEDIAVLISVIESLRSDQDPVPDTEPDRSEVPSEPIGERR